MSTTGALEVKNLEKKFPIGDKMLHVLSGINLHIPAGEFVAIVGASGCGKSTLLRAIVGLDLDYTGDILLDGVKLGKPTLQRAVVFQEHRLFPWMTAEQNIRLGLIKSKMSTAEQDQSVKEHLELVGLTAFAKAYPSQLSGGMSQRVAIARALVNRPKILLLDEPLGALDALTRGRLQDELRRIVDSEGITAVLVTHDVEEAIYLADRIVVMRSGPGRIAEVVPVPKTMNRSRIDAEFIRMREDILGRLGEQAHELV